MIEFKPEAQEELKKRFKASLMRPYSPEQMLKNNTTHDRPSNKRENVFDFEDGIRLIVSREVIGSKEVIHFSASMVEHCYKGPRNRTVLDYILNKFYDLYGSKPAVKFIGFTPQGIPHWIVGRINLS